MIDLGYELGTGKRVSIPLNHMAVIGQTQVSGKTTTLEALVDRSGLRAIAFITKPGEKNFRLQTAIPPFFSESTLDQYSKYVASIIEQKMNVHLGWRERGWIIKLCRDYERPKTKTVKGYKWKKPKSLSELLANVEIALPHLRGTEEMICMELQEYLKPVVKEVDRVDFSSTLELARGINVMDITDLSDGLKTLVIRSVIEFVHKKCRKVVVIIPEAWKFIPEGRSTPVKLALEGLIREGGGVENFVWMDSQDLRGVDKMLLRSVIVWLFGVQRQRNEVANTLDSIPDHPKPSASQIMQLGKGQFYVCYGTTLTCTYVQPAGMEDEHAKAIALGDEEPESWKGIAAALNARSDEPRPEQAVLSADSRPDGGFDHRSGRQDEGSGTPLAAQNAPEEEEAMWKEKYEALKVEFDILTERIRGLEKAMLVERWDETAKPTFGQREAAKPQLFPPGVEEIASKIAKLDTANGNLDAIYRYIVDRACREQEPAVLSLLAERPELMVNVQRKTIQMDGVTLRGFLATLITEKFFDTPKNGNQAFQETQRRGRRTAKPNVYRELDGLTELGFLVKEESGYQAVAGMKIRIQETQ